MTLRSLLLWPALLLAVLTSAHAAQTGCLEYPYDAPGDPLASDIAAARKALTPFKSLLTSLDAARPVICATDAPSEALGTFGADENRITIGATLAQPKRIAVLLHEIRHLDQNLRGICPATTLSMRENARAMFALEADAMAVMHLIAWSNLDVGSPEIFDALRAAPETSDIAAAFENAMAETNDPALATAAAFDAWYASDARRERYYVSTCMAYLDRLEAEDSLAGTAPLTADFLDHVCHLPDQSSYPCQEPDRPIPR
jgi:hypothetical protein